MAVAGRQTAQAGRPPDEAGASAFVASAAAALQADLDNPTGAISVYDRMVEAAVPASNEARKRAEALRGSLLAAERELE